MTADHRTTWDLRPFEGFGPLRFGMLRSEVQQVLGTTPLEFRKAPSSKSLTQAYDRQGLHAYYDDSDRLEYADVFDPCVLRWGGVDLLNPDASSVVGELAGLGVEARDDGDGSIWFDSLGFALYAPDKRIEGVGVFTRGYPTGAKA